MKKERKLKSNNFINWIQFTVLLLVLWLVLSGIFEFKFIAFGAGTCLLISIICLNKLTISNGKSEHEFFILHLNWPRMIVYFLWLTVEIVKAALYISGVILFNRKKLNPQIVWFKAEYDNPVARVLLANSITITPGTITVDLSNEGVYAVHALTDELAEGIRDMGMQKKIAWAFGEDVEFSNLKLEYDEMLAKPKHAKLLKKRFKGRVNTL
ncbi:MAG: Na+/H+ antiporter subunit E [Clostridiales bacterium]|nr:Na+/H+ antiporter subunit E [Candidatus Crickella caballi]